MPEMNIEVAHLEHQVYFRISGRANYAISPAFCDVLNQEFSNKPVSVHFLLEQCSCMDSTFIGALTGYVLEHTPRGCRFFLHGAQEPILQSLESLGVLKFFMHDTKTHSDVPLNFTDILKQTPPEKQQCVEHMLEAHQTLIAVNQKNQSRFKDVLSLLRLRKKN